MENDRNFLKDLMKAKVNGEVKYVLKASSNQNELWAEIA